MANEIYNSGHIPTNLSQSVFIALPKKPGAIECELHRTISLMSHVMKIILRVLMERMRRVIRPEINEAQYGFVPDAGTRNAIFALRMLCERSIEVQRDVYLCFIDYKKAFDRVRHEELMSILEDINVDGKDVRLLSTLYWEQKAAVRVDDTLSDFVHIKRGVRQGSVCSPDLFNVYSEFILRNIEPEEGCRVGGRNVNNLRYADDTVLISYSKTGLQRLLNIVSEKSLEKGLDINIKKTECMVVSKQKDNPVCDLQLRGQQITQVTKFKYLGSIITSDGRCDDDVKARIGMAKDAFQKMKGILVSSNLSINTRKRILKCYISSILLYGSECWTLTPKNCARLQATEMWFYRRMLKISWTEKVTNEEVLERMSARRELLYNIHNRQMSFLGHIIRKEGLERDILTRKMNGKRGPGRPRIKFMDSISQRLGVPVPQIFHRAADRDAWKSMSANVQFGEGTEKKKKLPYQH